MARETFAIVTGAVPTLVGDDIQLAPDYSINKYALENVTAISTL